MTPTGYRDNAVSTHTRGPWSMNGSAVEAEDSDGLGVLVAHVYHADENGAPEYRENARLIAARVGTPATPPSTDTPTATAAGWR
jgi:hypothetical protein